MREQRYVLYQCYNTQDGAFLSIFGLELFFSLTKGYTDPEYVRKIDRGSATPVDVWRMGLEV